MSKNFKLEFYSGRSGPNHVLDIERTADGWIIRKGAKGGNCDKTGAPHLFEILENKGTNYPAALGGYIKWLWEKSKEQHLSDDEIQENINMLGEWLQIVEKSSPKGIWRPEGGEHFH